MFGLRKTAESITKLDEAEVIKLDAEGLRREILKAKDPGIDGAKLDDDAYVRARLDVMEDKRDSANRIRDPKRFEGKREDKDDGNASPLAAAYDERTKRQLASRNRKSAE